MSARVDRGEVERTRRRAELLRRAGFRAIPVVAGEALTQGASEEAERHSVLVLEDGIARHWPEALGALPPTPPSAD